MLSDGMTLRCKAEGWLQLAGAGLATIDLAGCVGHPGGAAIFMITSIYLVASGAWTLAS
jgi:hypothetical protein